MIRTGASIVIRDVIEPIYGIRHKDEVARKLSIKRR